MQDALTGKCIAAYLSDYIPTTVLIRTNPPPDGAATLCHTSIAAAGHAQHGKKDLESPVTSPVTRRHQIAVHRGTRDQICPETTHVIIKHNELLLLLCDWYRRRWRGRLSGTGRAIGGRKV